MATLPDLDTSKVGMIGYWNATNHGVSEIDPMDALTYTDITEYTQYDNGIQGKIKIQRVSEGTSPSVVRRDYVGNQPSGPKNIEFNFRMKSDGWILVWTDRTNQYGIDWFRNNTEGYRGYYDIIDSWSALGFIDGTNDLRLNYNHSRTQIEEIKNLPETELSDEIQTLQSKLSNSGNITFNHSDVGYYCYEFPNANRMALAFETYDNGIDGGISYTSDVTKKYHACIGMYARNKDGLFSDEEDEYLSFAGKKLVNIPIDTREYGIGNFDVLANNLTPNSGTTYYNDTTPDTTGGYVGIYHLILYNKP
jgi:hypothetical protein